MIQAIGVEAAVEAQAIGVARIAAFGGEKRQVPILDHIPPEGVAGVNEGGDEPERIRRLETRTMCATKCGEEWEFLTGGA